MKGPYAFPAGMTSPAKLNPHRESHSADTLEWSNETRLYHRYPRVDMQPVRRIDALHVMGSKLATHLPLQDVISACRRLTQGGISLYVMVGNEQLVQTCRGCIQAIQRQGDTLHCCGDNFSLTLDCRKLADMWLVNPLNSHCRKQPACLEGYDQQGNLCLKMQPEPASPHRENWNRLFATL